MKTLPHGDARLLEPAGGSCMTGNDNEALMTFIVPEDFARLSTGRMVVPFHLQIARCWIQMSAGTKPRSTSANPETRGVLVPSM